MKNTVLFASLLALSGFSAAASAADRPLGFLHGEVGRSNVDVDVAGFGSGSDNDTSFSVRGGYFFNANFAVEGFYSNVYDESEDGVSAKLSALGIGLVAKRNFGADGNGFFIDGRAGIARGTIDASIDGLGSDSAGSTKPYFGVGAGYDFSSLFGVSLNFDRLKGEGDGISITADTLTLGAEIRF